MNRFFRILGSIALGLSLLACTLHVTNSGRSEIVPPQPGEFRFASHNVHYIILREAEGAWSVADWNRRKGAFDAAFKTMSADVVAFQEMESFAGGNDGSVNLARDYLLDGNPAYAAAAVGDWRRFPSTQPIFYRTDRLRLEDQGWFFFSDTPDVIYSRTYDGSYPAFASWARFAPQDGRPFHVVNVHFEFSSASNRRKSAALVARRIAPWVAEGTPVVLLGDVNALSGSDTVATLTAAGLVFAPVSGATYHFNRGINLFGAIDRVAATPQFRQRGQTVVVRRKFLGAWPSDHYPTYADFELVPQGAAVGQSR